jgi:hypothetical protein
MIVRIGTKKIGREDLTIHGEYVMYIKKTTIGMSVWCGFVGVNEPLPEFSRILF